ncbi:hypothetical protein DFP72DRAFT_1062485 [Ephemerocybe angulata]|uniref:Uncharacterized protein n=1 Tax=Ephemerocybe angulata TaxID=980116 RepID=A0A8H6I876_9AGAR|nr:hypothetical protein DFP72DRAFT_1062485 [Tulosesus angulatus]
MSAPASLFKPDNVSISGPSGEGASRRPLDTTFFVQDPENLTLDQIRARPPPTSLADLSCTLIEFFRLTGIHGPQQRMFWTRVVDRMSINDLQQLGKSSPNRREAFKKYDEYIVSFCAEASLALAQETRSTRSDPASSRLDREESVLDDDFLFALVMAFITWWTPGILPQDPRDRRSHDSGHSNLGLSDSDSASVRSASLDAPPDGHPPPRMPVRPAPLSPLQEAVARPHWSAELEDILSQDVAPLSSLQEIEASYRELVRSATTGIANAGRLIKKALTRSTAAVPPDAYSPTTPWQAPESSALDAPHLTVHIPSYRMRDGSLYDAGLLHGRPSIDSLNVPPVPLVEPSFVELSDPAFWAGEIFATGAQGPGPGVGRAWEGDVATGERSLGSVRVAAHIDPDPPTSRPSGDQAGALTAVNISISMSIVTLASNHEVSARLAGVFESLDPVLELSGVLSDD